MEIYALFRVFFVIVLISGVQPTFALFCALGMAVVGCGVLFVLQGIGLYKMAKNRNFKNKWLVFVPFAYLFYMGKLTGPCNIFSQKVKRMGLYAMLAQIATILVCFASLAAVIYLYMAHGLLLIDETGFLLLDETIVTQGAALSGFAKVCFNYCILSNYILSILQLIYEILVFVLFLGLYKKYIPANYFGMGMLTLFLWPSRYIITFSIRNRQAIDYEAYIRARQEQFMRSRQQYGNYSNPYGKPYGNPYGNPYNNPYRQPQQPPKQEDPFAEFGGKAEDNQMGSTQNNGFGGGKDESPFEDF